MANDPTGPLEIEIEAGFEDLHLFRDYVDRKGRQLGMEPELLGDLRLVVDEAVTNVIEHGYGGTSGLVGLQMDRRGEDVFICIRDRAETFTPEGVADPAFGTPLAQRQPGGMGLFLIKRIMDTVDYVGLPGGGNEIRLTKKIA